MKQIEAILKKITGVVSIISYVGIVVIVLITVCDIGLRFLTGRSILGCYEIVQVLLMMTVFASFAYTQSEKGHISVTFIIIHFPEKLQMFLYSVLGFCSTIISVLVSYAAFKQMQGVLATDTTTQTLLIPMAPFFVVEGIGMLIFSIALCYDAVKGVIGIFNSEVATEIKADWS